MARGLTFTFPFTITFTYTHVRMGTHTRNWHSPCRWGSDTLRSLFRHTMFMFVCHTWQRVPGASNGIQIGPPSALCWSLPAACRLLPLHASHMWTLPDRAVLRAYWASLASEACIFRLALWPRLLHACLGISWREFGRGILNREYLKHLADHYNSDLWDYKTYFY